MSVPTGNVSIRISEVSISDEELDACGCEYGSLAPEVGKLWNIYVVFMEA